MEFRPVPTTPQEPPFFVLAAGLYIHSSFNLSTTATSAQRQRTLKYIPNNQNNLTTTTNQRLRNGAYLSPCTIVKGHETARSVPRVVGLCSCLVSVLLIFDIKNVEPHITPLPFLHGHFHLFQVSRCRERCTHANNRHVKKKWNLNPMVKTLPDCWHTSLYQILRPWLLLAQLQAVPLRQSSRHWQPYKKTMFTTQDIGENKRNCFCIFSSYFSSLKVPQILKHSSLSSRYIFRSIPLQR